MASEIFALDIQADALRLVLQPPGKPPRFYKKELPERAISDPEGLSATIRQFLRENKISRRRCVLVLPRQWGPEEIRPLLKKAGLAPVRAYSKEAAYASLVTDSACLVVPEEGGFQAYFFCGGALQRSRAVDGPRALNQFLQISRFSNPELPISGVYLPGDFPGAPAGDPDIHSLEDLLPRGLPAEAAAAGGALGAGPESAYSYPSDFGPKQLVKTAGLALAASLFLYSGVFQPLAERRAALDLLARQQALADQLEARLEGYDGLSADYLRTGGGILTDAELALADRNAILELAATVISPRASVTELTLSGNSLTLHLTDISLQAAGALVSELKRHPLITDAQLHSAEAASGESSNIFLRITLADALKEAEP